MTNFFIETERLRLLPMTYEFVSKVLYNDCTAYKALGVKPIEDWPKDADINVGVFRNLI